MRIFHLATQADWEAARVTGRYTTSTRGRTLAEEGFIHASRGDQWQGVRDRYYADVDEPLVLLTIETDLLTSPVLDEPVSGSDETYPHIYGAIEVAAVVTVIPLDEPAATDPQPRVAAVPPPGVSGAPEAPQRSFSALFFAEMFHNLLLALIVMATVGAGALLGEQSGAEWGAVIGIGLGLGLGILLARAVTRLRAARQPDAG